MNKAFKRVIKMFAKVWMFIKPTPVPKKPLPKNILAFRAANKTKERYNLSGELMSVTELQKTLNSQLDQSSRRQTKHTIMDCIQVFSIDPSAFLTTVIGGKRFLIYSDDYYSLEKTDNIWTPLNIVGAVRLLTASQIATVSETDATKPRTKYVIEGSFQEKYGLR